MTDKQTTKTFSSKQEKLVASILGGAVVPGSGARPTVPGDVKSETWLAECKTHTEPGHNIFFDIKVWKKICDEAMALHRLPVLVVDDGSQKEKNTWCLCRSSSINKTNLMVMDFPASIRKNITCKDEKLKETLKQANRYLGAFYIGTCFDVNWDGEDVSILPITTFKEVYDK